MVGKDVASTFLCCFVGILMPERRINCFMIRFSEILRHFNHKNYNREGKTYTIKTILYFLFIHVTSLWKLLKTYKYVFYIITPFIIRLSKILIDYLIA